jgi:hypothetical protein
MNCFNHRTSPAVGICKFCGKGVCQACAADTGHGLACRDTCEEQVGVLAAMVRNNARIMKAANRQVRSAGLYGVIAGAIFLGFAGWMYSAGQQFLALLFAGFGLPLALFGIVKLVAERYPTPDDKS